MNQAQLVLILKRTIKNVILAYGYNTRHDDVKVIREVQKEPSGPS